MIKYKIIVSYATETTTQMYNYYYWSNWCIDYPNENQLELFDIYKYQKYDRFGKLIDKNKPRRDVIIK